VALGVLSGAWIVLNQYTQYALWRTALGAVVNTVLNLFLIPSFGIAGAASATVVAFIATAFASDAILERTRPLLYLKLRALDLRRTKDPDDE
jgi:O-antigen/teichoic acid export membrane protein